MMMRRHRRRRRRRRRRATTTERPDDDTEDVDGAARRTHTREFPRRAAHIPRVGMTGHLLDGPTTPPSGWMKNRIGYLSAHATPPNGRFVRFAIPPARHVFVVSWKGDCCGSGNVLRTRRQLAKVSVKATSSDRLAHRVHIYEKKKKKKNQLARRASEERVLLTMHAASGSSIYGRPSSGRTRRA